MEVKNQEGILDKIRSNKVVKKLKSIKNLEIIVAIFIIAIALLIYSSVISNKPATKNTNPVVSTMDSEEQKLASILSGLEGAGKVETMITRNDDEIVGVLVLSEGAENITVMLRILDATSTVLGVDKNLIEVYQMK